MTSSKTHLVSLIGAGPGDPELLTVKAYRLIQKADVVVYDRLVSEEIMALTRSDAEKIYVGKKLDNHCVPQDQINQILVDKALESKHVVRLKGGDPFIFGRGGEELEALANNHITFEVVPGITAASGCSAYAGIPLTHRDHAQSVQFVAGHLKKPGHFKGGSEDIHWQSLVQSNSTLVFYMGLKQAPVIQQNLIKHGLAENTPCAIIEQGTTPNQKVFTAQLNGLDNIATQATSPALIIVGSVVSLHHKLGWFKES